MKVLYVATYSGTSGASHSLVNMIVQMKKIGIKPMLIIPNRGPLEELLDDNNISYKRIKQYYWVTNLDKRNSFLDSIKWFVKQVINTIQELRIYFIIKKQKINLVHINAITSSNSYLAARISKTPIVWHIREFLEEDLNRKFRNRKKAIHRLNNSDSIIAISDSVKKKYENIIDNENIIRIYNGVDQTKYQNIENNIFENETIILTLVGRYVPQKGHLEVIHAVNKVIQKYKNPIKVRFIGDKGDGEFVLELKNTVTELSLSKYVEFIGYKADIHKFWGETDIALVASKAEAFGRVTIEAMLAGALVIGADTEGTAELISDQYGLLYKQGDYNSLADQLMYAIDNIDRMKEIAISAKRYAMKNFTAEKNANNILEVYKNLINSCN